MEAMLARSQQLPISVVIEDNSGHIQADGHPLASACTRLRNIPRIKELRYVGYSIHPFLQAVLEQDAPVLESLTLVSYLNIGSQVLSNKTVFLGKNPPQLKKLKLVRCCIGWRSPLLFSPTLTELKIYCESEPMRPSLSQIREVLLSLRGLINLVLVDVVRTRSMEWREHPDAAPFPIPALDDASKVPLFHLQSLRFSTETPIDIRDFLAILSTPSDTVLHLRFTCLDGFRLVCTPPEVTVHNIVHSIHDFFALSSRPAVEPEQGRESGYRSIGILSTSLLSLDKRTKDFCIVVGNHDRSTSNEAVPLQEAPTFYRQTEPAKFVSLDCLPVWDTKFFLGLPSWAADHSRVVLPMMCRLFPLRGVDTVLVNSSAFSDPELWWRTFGWMEHVTTVVVSGDAVCGFAAALRGKGRPSTPIYAYLNSSDRDIWFEERWGAMTARPLPAFIDDLELPSQLFPNLLHLQIESLSAEKPALGLPNVSDDLTKALEALVANRGLWNRADAFPAGVGPLTTLEFAYIGPGKNDSPTVEELKMRSSFSRFVQLPGPQNLRLSPTDKPSLRDEDSMHWIARQGGCLRDHDYF
ncbi:hypothetical protein BV25DRAFT_1922401 [Artomyces pyxidatus]|uniref:Uncharacterized protein n=1 Tax=Artomyces pyxidatus TaxID=48021 RepID=A0ACB8SFG5_9AGAM|nr:hypothetical protein BV25DRAFT_1922401 [Artomyces pyxidatus]